MIRSDPLPVDYTRPADLPPHAAWNPLRVDQFSLGGVAGVCFGEGRPQVPGMWAGGRVERMVGGPPSETGQPWGRLSALEFGGIVSGLPRYKTRMDAMMATWIDFQKQLHTAKAEGNFTLTDAQMKVMTESVLQYYRDQYKVALYDHDGDEIDEQGNKLRPRNIGAIKCLP